METAPTETSGSPRRERCIGNRDRIDTHTHMRARTHTRKRPLKVLMCRLSHRAETRRRGNSQCTKRATSTLDMDCLLYTSPSPRD
eukprot:5570060-Alexandrium_andersonii.AAC.1